MSAVVIESSTASTTTTARVTQASVVHGEWIKLRSVRSTVITLAAAAIATVVLGAAFSAVAGTDGAVQGPTAGVTDPVEISLGALGITQLIVGIVGALVVAGEYSTGLIRTTFAAVGSRVAVLRAKALVVGLTVFVTMGVAITAAVAIGQSVYGGEEATASLLDPGMPRVLLGATVYVAGVALIGVALGFLMRSTAGAIGTLVATLFILPTLLQLLPDSFTDAVLKFFPSQLGDAMMSRTTGENMLSPGAAFVWFGVWLVAILGSAAWSLKRRDA